MNSSTWISGAFRGIAHVGARQPQKVSVEKGRGKRGGEGRIGKRKLRVVNKHRMIDGVCPGVKK